METSIVQSPIGSLKLEASEEALHSISFLDADLPEQLSEFPILQETQKQLAEYFSGKRKVFELPLCPKGTDFQKSVWDEVYKVPFGETASYLAISKQLGNPDAIRAVGTSNGRNPIPIIIPCHRIIGSDGSLTGYAGGLARKKWLLDHEAKFSGKAVQQELF